VHVVWQDPRDGNLEIYYKRSTDEGITWGTDTRLTNSNSDSYYPSIALSGSLVHVVWEDNRDGNDEIYYKRSTDGGINWGADTRLTSNSAYSWTPSLAVNGSNIHVVWKDMRDSSTGELYYKRSTDGGINWGADTRLTNNPAYTNYGSVAVSGTTVHIAWYDNRDGNYEIYYKRSTDGGLSWGTDTRLTNDPAFSSSPSISVSGLTVHIVWHDSRDGNTEVYYKRSTDGGTSWGTDTRLSNIPYFSSLPNISVSGSVVHVAWQDNRDGNDEIYYKRSIDGGTNWETDTRLTNNSSISERTSIAVSGIVVHVVWRDNRDGNYEIYYKRNPTGTTGIQNISTETPSKYSLSQNYPNPFNPISNIKYKISKSTDVKITVFDVTGKEVEVLVNEKQSPGEYLVTFEGSMLNSGVYFYKLTVRHGGSSTDGFNETKKMVLIK
jgi:hypothetical protein